MRTPTALFIVAISFAPALLAQKPAPEPVRPRLGAGMDTNDARAYLMYGSRMIDSKPEEASKAYYWA